MEWQQVRGGISDVAAFLGSLAATIAAVVAIMGYSHWKKQTVFQHKVKLAQSIFDGALDYKRAIEWVRYTFLDPADIASIEISDLARQSAQFKDEDTFREDVLRWRRFKKIENIRVNMRHLEAKASFAWSGAADGQFTKIFELEDKLHDQLSRPARLMSPKVSNCFVGGRLVPEEESVRVSGAGAGRPDPFDEELSQEIVSLLAIMSKRMGLSP